MFHMPMSSPMMKTMLGFLSAAHAGVNAARSTAAANTADTADERRDRLAVMRLLFMGLS